MKHSDKWSTDARAAAWFANHYGVISRPEALALGLTAAQVDGRLQGGAWEIAYRGVYRLAGSPRGLLPDLRAALLAGGPGAAVSHRSAAWLWGMTPTSPSPDLALPTITVPRNRLLRVDGIHVVRSRRPPRPVQRQGLPCTSAVRTLLDCARQMDTDEFDDLVDTALARRVVPVDALGRIARDRDLLYYPGRRSVAAHLAARGVSGSPHPSVLESRMARLFRRHRPPPAARRRWCGARAGATGWTSPTPAAAGHRGRRLVGPLRPGAAALRQPPRQRPDPGGLDRAALRLVGGHLRRPTGWRARSPSTYRRLAGRA